MRRLGLILALVAFAGAARADEPPPAAPQQPDAAPQQPPAAPQQPLPSRLVGRIRERGSFVLVAGAQIEPTGGETIFADEEGRFSLDVPPGDVEFTIRGPGYEPLRVKETLAPNTERTVEYRLLPLPSGKTSRYRSTVRGSASREGDRFTLKEAELQQTPGAVGDPFRVIASLPGVVAPVPVLPIYVIRGGSPGMNGFFLDGMRVPQLFHLVLVDGVVHPRILDHIDFFPGSYDATFGRYASGVVDAGTRPARADAPFHGELELRIYDVAALAEGNLPGGVSVVASGRYGFPGPVIRLAQPGIDLNFWDYQLRVDWRGFTVQALGSYDSLRLDLEQLAGRSGVAAQMLVEFHRLQLRHRYRKGAFEFDAALVGGLDRMSIFSGQGVQKLGLSARIEARLRLWKFQFAAGADGEVSRFAAQQFQTDESAAAPDQLGELAGDRDGLVGGAYAQATLVLDDILKRPAAITAGVRADVYHAGRTTLLGVDPRVLFRYAPLKELEFFGGFGQYTQAPSFPVPLPGIDTFALQLGLQKAWQGSAGIRLKLPGESTLSLTGYYGRFDNINDVVIDFVAAACTSPPPERITGIAAYVTRQVKGAGYGMEVLARARRIEATKWLTLSGWLSYTLSRSERVFSCGIAPSDFDQTHVLNAVVRAQLPWRLVAGLRLAVSTGRPYTQLVPDLASGTISGDRNGLRLPTYVQLDLRVDREWIFERWALNLFIEALNVTNSESIYGVTYPKDPTLMITRYDQPQFNGFRWILPSIGARGSF